VSETRYKHSVDPVKTDGRDIDREIGQLVGEAAQQVSGKVDQHIQNIAQEWKALPAPEKNGPSYYNRPMLKEPVWKWFIPLYYYLGGASGATLVIGAAAQLDRSGRLDQLIRRCHWTGILGSSVSGALLIFDLGRPSRFLHMFRVFRPTSPMNVGVWILSGAAPAAITASFLARRRGIWGALGEVCGIVSGLFGLGLATYTGVLVGNSAIPLWQESRLVLPILFGASGVASAGSIFDLLAEDKEARRITFIFGTAGRVAELAAAFAMERQAARIPRVALPLKNGASGLMWRAAAVLTAASLIAGLLPGGGRKKRIAAGVLGTAGSLLLRFAVHHAGVISARDPRASFHSQTSSKHPNALPPPA
jgi:formate-dependent nitrite reductase membrane component NrfD